MSRTVWRAGVFLAVAVAANLWADEAAVVEQLKQSLARYNTPALWAARRTELREQFLKGAGLWPLPARPFVPAIRHSYREHTGYSVENVALETFPGFYCTGNLYRPLPAAERGPAILSPHGHFRPLGRFREDQQIRCAQLARMGATVFSYSMVGWQDSQQTTHDDPRVLALQTWNSLRVVDFLTRLDGVDAQRIGVTGASGGGTQAFFLALVDDRVQASAPLVIVYPWAAPEGCRCEGGLPVMQAAGTNAIELAAATAPRPQLLISVGNDPTRNFPEVGFPFIRRMYEIAGAADRVRNVHLADEGHDFGPTKRREVYAFFAQHLRLPHRAEDAASVVFESPAQMEVFSAAHPRPPSALQGSEAVGRGLEQYLAELRRAPVARASPASPARPLANYTFQEAGPADEALIFTPPGFSRVGQPAVATGPGTGTLRISVRAEPGRVTPCRINVVGPDGNYYEPAAGPLKIHSLTGLWPNWPQGWGNRPGKAPIRYLGRYFYSTGEAEVQVPAGTVRVEVWKGLEYRPESVTLQVVPGRSHDVAVELTRGASMPDLGYWSGDPHIHIPRKNAEDEERILDLLEAEDIHYGTVLAYNEPAGPYAGFMDRMDSPQFRGLGNRSLLIRGAYTMVSGQEYRSSTYGHLNLFQLDDLVLAGQELNANNWPPYGEIVRTAREAGGYAFYAHGGYAQEIYADVVQGLIDGVELLQFGVYRGIGLADWYRILNTGFRFPAIAASDYPACRKLGDCQTYVHHGQQPSMDAWLRGAAEGRSFVTTGPLLLLDVEGHGPGARLERAGGGPFKLATRVRVRSEVAPVTTVQLIVNGRVVQELNVPASAGQHSWIDLPYELEVSESVWIAARAFSQSALGTPDAESHTNPVYVYVNGRAPYERESLDGILAAIDGQIAVHKKRTFPEQARVLAYFEKSRDILIKIREAGGVPSSGHPSEIARHLPALDNPGQREHTDDELRAFLQPVPAKTVDEALRSFETTGGFQVQRVASEPLVFDPIAAAFDEDGNLYVCEMRDYPYKPQPDTPPIGSIRLLRDLDGDGEFDESHLFADQLLWAGGVAPWKGGVFVAAPPDIWYLRDTDGDHRADERHKVYTGFGLQNQQAMVNNLQWWLDHRIYGSSAGNGGKIERIAAPHEPAVDVNGRDFRFDPVSGAFESITGTVQFGTTFDDWGNRFLCSESQPLHHALLPQHYLARNRYLPVPTALQNLAPGPVEIYRISPLERWRMIRSSRRIAHQNRSATSAGASHHVIDAAAGVTVYRGGAYPREYYGQVFIGDAQNNLVHRRSLQPHGVTFKSERVDSQTEFLRSSDNWFRPVNFLNAPDGTLYVLDMSREILESIHVPSDVARFLDFKNGRDRGRIYRIAPPGFRYPGPPRLGAARIAELVAALESPHGWWRDTAHRLIYERQDRSAVAPLRQLLLSSQLPQARLHALYSLRGLDALRPEDVLRGLADPHPRVREHALQLAEPWLDEHPAMLEGLLAAAESHDARLRLQAAFSLGESRDPRAVHALATMARRDAAEHAIRTALLSSAAEQATPLFVELLADRGFADSPAGLDFLKQLATIVSGRGVGTEIQRALRAIADMKEPSRQRELVMAVGRPLARAGRHFRVDAFDDPVVADLLQRLLSASSISAASLEHPAESRQTAIGLIGCFNYSLAGPTLQSLLAPQHAQDLQLAAVRALATYPEDAVADVLIEHWSELVPTVRQEATTVLLGRDVFARSFLRAADAGIVSVATLEANHRSLLQAHRDAEVRQLARKLLGDERVTPRGEVVEAYRAALDLPGDAARGQTVFRRECTACHRVGDTGHAIGPDLASTASREAAALLVHVLDPNRYLLPTYEQYVVRDDTGRVLTGMIASQTATSLTLKREESKTETILRANVEEIRATGQSLMPEGFEKKVPLQEMADLVAYLRSVRPASGDLPLDIGTTPGLVEPE